MSVQVRKKWTEKLLLQKEQGKNSWQKDDQFLCTYMDNKSH